MKSYDFIAFSVSMHMKQLESPFQRFVSLLWCLYMTVGKEGVGGGGAGTWVDWGFFKWCKDGNPKIAQSHKTANDPNASDPSTVSSYLQVTVYFSH